MNSNKKNKYVSWCGTISEEIFYKSPKRFPSNILKNQANLFAHRGALFYTPTKNLPKKFIGKGSLDILIPVPTPDFSEIYELRNYITPKFWIDQIQRQTNKIRWTPMNPARVIFTRYDFYKIRHDHAVIGCKALLDAFKVRTTGRKNGIYLYYFGAIIDDSQDHIDVSWKQRFVDHPKKAHMRIQVSQLKKLPSKIKSF